MRNEPDWLTAADLEELNKQIVATSGEPFGVLKPNELSSAAVRPVSLWLYEDEDDIAWLAVRLMIGIAANHPFEQGNKRTAFIAAVLFLEANGWELSVPDTEEVADRIIEAIASPDVERDLVTLFRDHLTEISTQDQTGLVP